MSKTAYLYDPLYLQHETGQHPEQSARLNSINRDLEGTGLLAKLEAVAPRQAELEDITRIHDADHAEMVQRACNEGRSYLDADTTISPRSYDAALLSAGAGLTAVDLVVDGKADNVFCAVRPPGHHAERDRAMGFCLFNSAAVAAMHARSKHGAERVAVIDFDVHHGNGTQDIFWDQKDLFYGSTHQMPLYPGTGATGETGVGNICNAPLHPGDDGVAFRDAMEVRILPALEKHNPDLIIISAGFDAHQRDPLANLNLVEEDYAWVTRKLMDIADKQCEGRVVSVLEGGYDLMGLSLSVAAHVRALMGS